MRLRQINIKVVMPMKISYWKETPNQSMITIYVLYLVDNISQAAATAFSSDNTGNASPIYLPSLNNGI